MGKNNHKGARIRGNPDPTTRDEHSSPGTITAVFPDDYACRVRDDLKGATHDVAVPGLVQDPEGGGGEVFIPRIGQRVELKFGSGTRPRISRCLPHTIDSLTTKSETPALFEKEQTNLNLFGNAPNNFRGYMPSGLMSGDWCRMGNLGQHVGIFDGGVATLCGSKWAQVKAVGGQGADTLSLYGRRTNIFTDFGNVIFGSESGKSFVELLGGTDQTLESGVDRQNWTIRAAIGKGDGFANFAILDRDGEAIYKTVIEADGTVQKTTAGSGAQVFGGDQSAVYEKTFTRVVQSGDDTLSVAGNRIESYEGNQETTVQQNQNMNILSSASKIVGGNDFTSCKTHDLQVTGRLEAVPTDPAAAWKIANGDLNIEVGKPPADLQKSLSSFNVTVYPPTAKIALKSMLGSVETFSLIETKVESVALINMKAGGMFKAEAGGLMEFNVGGAMMGKAAGVMQMTSVGPSMFGSSIKLQLGGLTAVEPVIKGLTALPALASFLTTLVSAGTVAGSTGQNAAALRAIGAAAGAVLGSISSWPSAKVFTE